MSVAAATARASRADFPTPGRPRTTSAPPRPARASATTDASLADSASRPYSTVRAYEGTRGRGDEGPRAMRAATSPAGTMGTWITVAAGEGSRARAHRRAGWRRDRHGEHGPLPAGGRARRPARRRTAGAPAARRGVHGGGPRPERLAHPAAARPADV